MARAIKDYNSVNWGELFYYDPSSKTGLCWKIDRFGGKAHGRRVATRGSPAGSIMTRNNKQYATISCNGTNWFAHRVIWILFNGYLDKELVCDHLDGDSLNNNIDNIRVVSQKTNNRNTKMRKDNSTSICGVKFTTARNHKGGMYTYATASWYPEANVSKCKHFSVEKYGLLPAFALACKHRQQQITSLNSNNYGYSDTHGK